MERALKKLIARMPPPAKTQYTEVDWCRLENAIGISYPTTFKEYIDHYNGTRWFDDFAPIVTHAHSDADVVKFKKRIRQYKTSTAGNFYSPNFDKLPDPEFYPDKEGLFPFFSDASANLLFWKMEGAKPDEWPVVFWMRGPMHLKAGVTIAKILLGYIEREAAIVELLGDINDLPPNRSELRT